MEPHSSVTAPPPRVRASPGRRAARRRDSPGRSRLRAGSSTSGRSAGPRPAPKTTATPGTSSSRKASAGASPSPTSMAEVMAISARSIARERRQRASASAMNTLGAASSEEPMRFSRRSISSAPVTTRRTSRILSHLAASASSRHSAGTSGNRRRCTDEPSPGCRSSQHLFHGEDQDRREPGGEAIEQVVEHGQRWRGA